MKTLKNRENEPDFVRRWREFARLGPPRCCYTCDYFDQSGVCEMYNETPPEEFTRAVDRCEHWIQEFDF